jgi:extracellular elastinolytic metalloproteinase
LFDEDTDMVPIVLVDRGQCTFVTKARNLEKLGVKMSIVADSEEEKSENLIMADDGSGHTINIPTFIIRKKDSDKLKDTLELGSNVFLKAELDIAHPDNRVEYELWYS